MQIIWTPLLHIMVFIRRCSYTILYHIFHTSAGSPVVSPWDTSGAKTPPHALFPPHPSHHEQNRPPTHFSLLICYIRKTATCPTLHSTPHSHFPHVSHRTRKRHLTHFSLLICNIGKTLCRLAGVLVRRKTGFAHGLNKNCNRCAETAVLRTDCCHNMLVTSTAG